jgi:AraC-like DNA-binding protein
VTRAPGAIPVVFLGGPGVEYAERPPPAALAPWVAATWTVSATRRFDLRVLPDGCVDLIGGDVVGPFTSAIVARLEAGDEAHGIRLRPGAFPALFGVPAGELVDARIPLADLGPRPARSRTTLGGLAAAAPAPDPLAEAAMRSRDLAGLVRESGYSERHLRRRLLAAAGLGPKRLQRIGRMQAALRAGRGESWARTAAEHGWYDEAHMANDVRALAGATPHALLDDRFLQGGAPVCA